MKNTLSIILPCYNPINNWQDVVVEKMQTLLAMLPQFDLSLIIVIDGCENSALLQASHHIATTFPKTTVLSYSQNFGKGYALRHGVQHSISDYIIYTDIDFPYQIDSVVSVANQLQQHDIVIGTKNQAYYLKVPFSRRLISKLFKLVLKIFFKNLATSDTQCGLKGMNKKGRKLFLQTTIDRYLFDFEFVYLASKQKDISVITQAIQLNENVVFRKMDFKILMNEFYNFLKVLMK